MKTTKNPKLRRGNRKRKQKSSDESDGTKTVKKFH